MKDVVIVFDCGSTNLRVVAVDIKGSIVAQSSTGNSPKPQVEGKLGWLIWDLDDIWSKLCRLTGKVIFDLRGRCKVKAVIVTTWGADGVLVKKDGGLAYPAISWQCPRTIEVAREVAVIIDPWEIFKTTGYQVLSFNTLLKLMWIRRYEPEAFKKAYTWLMMPSYISFKLTGEFYIDPTSASTMMAMDLAKRDWSKDILSLVGLDSSFFPRWREAGEILGYVTGKASMETGLPEGLPVVVGGHDTQFAIMAAGAGRDEAVLSSGTWEILGLRLDRFEASWEAFKAGVIVEADVEPRFWNPQLLMIASAVLEWLRKLLYPETVGVGYEAMLDEASRVPAGCGGLMIIPSFVADSGPTKKYGVPGVVAGLKLTIGRGYLYRAALEGLSYQLRLALEGLEEAFRLKLEGVRVVGGGSRNRLWNQIRADVTGRRVLTTSFREATVLGAALTAFKGIDMFKSLEEALKSLDWRLEEFRPAEAKAIYQGFYDRYIRLLEALKPLYKL